MIAPPLVNTTRYYFGLALNHVVSHVARVAALRHVDVCIRAVYRAMLDACLRHRTFYFF